MPGSRCVVVLPGRTWGPSVPQVLLPALAAMRRGAEHLPLEWSDVEALDRAPRATWAAWVDAQASPVLDGCDPATTVVVGKSLGSLAAARCADLGLPAIWVTPLLREPEVVAAMERSAAPLLLVGGTADPLWDGEAARRISSHVVELAGADHGLLVPGPLAGSVRNLGALAEASERFLDEIVWPTRA